MYRKIIYMGILLIIMVSEYGCSKFLDKKSDQKLAIPSTTADLQALLDYYSRINFQEEGTQEVCSDNYYLSDATFNALTSTDQRNLYIWNEKNDFNMPPNDWSKQYDVVYIANTVIENASKVAVVDRSLHNSALGQAYFHRARSLLNIVGIWSLAYDSITASRDPGVPLKLSSDFNEKNTRGTLQMVYDNMIKDLMMAVDNLPPHQVTVLRPNKAAAYALLSRVYLYAHNYVESLRMADSCWLLSGQILDYNTLSTSTTYPIKRSNVEVLFESYMSAPPHLNTSRAHIDTLLYQSYEDNDLRKQLFFKKNADNTLSFRGSYIGSSNLFHGIATDEVLLTMAECEANLGQLEKSCTHLSLLLKNRYKKGTFTDITIHNKEQLLTLIYQEKRKELLFRSLRWMDIKRLNARGANISVSRLLNGVRYSLNPNSPKFALPIPEDIIQYSGMAQNVY